MIESIDQILPFLFPISMALFIVIIIVISAYKLDLLNNSKFWKYLKTNVFFKIFLTLGVISVILILSLEFYVSKLSRIEIKERIEVLSNKKFTLVINDNVAINDSLIVSLQNIESKTSSRNTGSPEINIRITDGDVTLEIKLLRDLSRKNKYWVFYNNYESTSKYCIGEINTSSLDKYQ